MGVVACSGGPAMDDPLSLPQVLVCPWTRATEPVHLDGSELGCWMVRVTRDTKVMRYTPQAGPCDVVEGQVSATFEDGAVVQFWQRVGAATEHLEAEEVRCRNAG